ncbi:MAG: hypothetical protein V4629_09475 [Pseudomonadota bacterium]
MHNLSNKEEIHSKKPLLKDLRSFNTELTLESNLLNKMTIRDMSLKNISVGHDRHISTITFKSWFYNTVSNILFI